MSNQTPHILQLDCNSLLWAAAAAAAGGDGGGKVRRSLMCRTSYQGLGMYNFEKALIPSCQSSNTVIDKSTPGGWPLTGC